MVNITFNQVLFVQFFSSILVLCTSVYYLAAHITETTAASFLVYTICMFAQIYIYCWAGNEVMLMVNKCLSGSPIFIPLDEFSKL